MIKSNSTTDKNNDICEEQNPVQKKASELLKDETSAETEVKNAHASGDGSFGRNDESLPDESTGIEEKDGSGY